MNGTPAENGDPRTPINPFLIPGREDAPMSTLCPWKEDTHAKLYIEIDNYAPAFADFQAQFTTPALLRESSRLALVAGESGCGKSALRNHCAHWLLDQLVAHGLTGTVIDLSREIDLTVPGNQVIDINRRIAHVSGRLVPRLARLDLIDAATRDALAAADTPDQVFAELATAMENKGRPEVVLILLLPSADHHGEIEKYAAMPGPRIVFFAESSYLRPPQVNSIAGGNDVEVPPATMTVGVLSAADIRLFVETRFEQRKDDGIFPRLEDSAVELLASNEDMSIAMLQGLLTGVYNDVRKSGGKYTNEATISAADLGRYSLHKLLAMMG